MNRSSVTAVPSTEADFTRLLAARDAQLLMTIRSPILESHSQTGTHTVRQRDGDTEQTLIHPVFSALSAGNNTEHPSRLPARPSRSSSSSLSLSFHPAVRSLPGPLSPRPVPSTCPVGLFLPTEVQQKTNVRPISPDCILRCPLRLTDRGRTQPASGSNEDVPKRHRCHR